MRGTLISAMLALFIAAAGRANASPILSDNSQTLTFGSGFVTLHKDMTAYGAYSPTGSDILYSGDTGTWTFSLAAIPSLGNYDYADVVLRMVLDDHYGRNPSTYSEIVKFNGVQAFSGTLALAHGVPFASSFTNWSSIGFSGTSIVNPFLVTVQNTSSGTGGGDWLAIDYIDVTLIDRDAAAVPEPASLLLIGSGLMASRWVRRRQSRFRD